MLANISNIDTDFQDIQIYVTEDDTNTLDKLTCILFSRLLNEFAKNYNYKDFPSDFEDGDEWMSAVSFYADCLERYTSIEEVSEIEELSIVEDAKEAVRFIGDYLDSFWMPND